jgi:hypothetical protein
MATDRAFTAQIFPGKAPDVITKMFPGAAPRTSKKLGREDKDETALAHKAYISFWTKVGK